MDSFNHVNHSDGFETHRYGDMLLDVGCGSGTFSSLASAIGAHVTGIDASESLIEQARERNTKFRMVICEG
jgi:2-polyprenyl-3-methyl-5-hydroxy-6-metoxy-1,4-benzoquinol methylase